MDFTHARTTMVDNQIRTEDVTDWNVLRAFLTVPREAFVPEVQQGLAYAGKDVRLANGRQLMMASSFARLLQLLAVRPDDAVLVVGCGSGYAAAIISRLAASVVALEEDPDLAASAREALTAHGGDGVSVVEGPLREGCAAKAPFDRIIFGGSVGALPSVFAEQLREGGRLVVVEGHGNAAAARVYFKEGGIVSDRFAFNCSVPRLPGFTPPAGFVF